MIFTRAEWKEKAKQKYQLPGQLVNLTMLN